MRDQNSIKLNIFRGLWARGDDDTVPADHFIDCENLIFNKIGTETREGTTIFTTRADRILRMRIYKPLNAASRIIMMQVDGTGSKVYDLTHSLTTPILDLSAVALAVINDFSLANMYGRAYITFHARTITTSGNNLWVYDGTGPTGMRAAGAAVPTSVLVETATGVGNIEAGVLLLTYCHETSSGFISKPYTATIISHTFAANANSITITVPVGPAGTVARRILACKTIPTGLYNGDYRSQVFYYVPGNGRIADNVTTSVVLSFFNSELIASADYLFDQITSPLGGLFINTYGTRLAVGGDSANPSIVRFSAPGEPESFSATSGFITVDPAEQGGIKNGFEYQGSFMVCKTKRTYVTSDNGSEASTWPVDMLDSSVGTECNGISVIADSPGAGAWKNVVLVADRAGLMLFNGSYSDKPLTDKVKTWWAGLDKAIFDQIQILVDPQIKRIYCLVPKGDDNTLPYPNTILVGDYENGLDPESIRWCPWAFYPEAYGNKASINCLLIDAGATTQKAVLKAGMTTDLVVFDPTVRNDLSSRYSIPSFARFGFLSFDETNDDTVSTFIALRFRIRGLGRVYISMTTMDDTITKAFQNYIDIKPLPGRTYDKLINFVGQKMSITLHMNTQATQPFNDNYWQLGKMIVFGKETWAALPSLTTVE